ncbi:hypothetical protein [Priestia taiwanensis]|uniref:Uncharacterized protein n=1 Tax=Priestia taiwanensis TaxID=1347902 RepID=A0A917ARK5_9BACI|nr:hypothetical protein [Priestia taiwanensis]MBM7363204.1 hypothetical protein [Priestia taiwanensis]GGE68511.1 hypothetical protein GCM10007140_18230 [Priestia taiwanensis]
MKKVKIPTFFHELFGSQQSKSEFVLVIAFTIVSTSVVGLFTLDYWAGLQWYQQLILLLLYLDIAGGVIANLTSGTDQHYHERPRARWIFIAIHVQPLLCTLLLGSSTWISVAVWCYTIVVASIINILRTANFHRTLAGCFVTVSLIGLFFTGNELEEAIFILYMMYMIKVIYSFAVHHNGSVR